MNEIYFTEKKINKKRLNFKLKIYGFLSLFILIIAAVNYAVIYSSLFQIKQIYIKQNGSEPINEKKLIEDFKFFLANQSKISAFLGANNILIWKNNTDQFLKNYPDITKLAIQKDYPNRTVNINVKGREKFGIWCLISSNLSQANASTTNTIAAIDNQAQIPEKCWWFDNSGVLFERAPSTQGEIIYKISDLSERPLDNYSQALDKNSFDNLIKIIKILESSGIKTKNLLLENFDLKEISTNSSIIPKIYFSLRINPESTSSVIESIKKIGLEKIEYIDLRVENRTYYKLK
ncbi:MAG: hypothetical protein AAB596_02585 [Patescibacteria group bacterium]